MRGILSIIIVGVFVLSGLSVTDVLSYEMDQEEMSSKFLENYADGVTVSVQCIGDDIYLTYSINGFDMEEILIDDVQYFKVMLDDESNIMERSCPDLPNVCRSVIIPDDLKMGVEIIDTGYDEFENVLIAPSKGILPRTVDPSDVPYDFGDVYDMDEWYPGDITVLDDPYILRDFRGQVVKVNPFQYNPVSKVLRVYNEITIKVSPVGPGEINVYYRTKPLTTMDTDFKPIYEHHFLNFNIGLNKGRYTPVEEQGNMLVICYDSFYSTMMPFVTWKNMKGVPTEIVNLSDVGSTANDIDTYIDTYYNTNNLTFVLLVGDIQQIPSLYYGSHASDPSFSYIVGSDNYQDLFVGRFSAQNIGQLETQVNRSIEYEKYPQAGADWYHKGTGIASNGGPGDDNEYDWEHMRNIRDDLLNFTYTEVDELYDGNHGGEDADGYPTSSMVSVALNDGRSIVNYVGHGGPTSWSTSGFSNSNINTLVNDNMLPYVTCVACNNGEFEHYDTCFAEAWMRATNSGEPTGAIGVFASTQSQSWSPPMDAQDEIVDLLVNGTMNTIGGLSFSGTMHMMDDYGSSCYDETNTWTLFGDPSLQMRTDTPAAMTVQHSPTITLDASSFDVTVVGVFDALCAISYNGELLGYNYTDAIGEATIQINEPITADMGIVDFVVTAFNKMPYITTLDVGSGLVNITTLHGNWNFISLPFNQSINLNDIIVHYNGTDYTWTEATDAINNPIIDPNVYSWDRTSDIYVQVVDTLESGYGYWIYAYDDCVLKVGNVTATLDNYITDLQQNWNIIGMPSDQSVNLTDLFVNYNGTDYTWAEATDVINGPIIDPNVYGWDRTLSIYFQVVDSLEPGFAYWIYIYYNCTLFYS